MNQKKTRTVAEYMTVSPHTIGAEQPLIRAHEAMRQNGIRHLPVLHAGKLVGIVSMRDLHLIETLKDVDPAKVTVEEAMSGEPYVVPPNAPLKQVAREMSERKLGSAVVVEDDRIVGMLTTVDALRALADAIQ